MDKQAAAYVRTLVLAALLGFPVAAAAVLFQTAIHDVIHFVWEVVPHWLDWSEPAGWYVVLVPALAGVLVALCIRLPGHGGHSPLHGISTAPIPPFELPSILLAGLATLGLGLVLGPEAPLIALGLGLGAIAVRLVRVEQTEAQLLALAGAFAAIAALFGGPLAASLMLLELVAMSGAIPSAMIVRALLPGFVAAGTGALVFTGVGGWRGAPRELAVTTAAARLRQRATGRPRVVPRRVRGHRWAGRRHTASRARPRAARQCAPNLACSWPPALSSECSLSAFGRLPTGPSTSSSSRVSRRCLRSSPRAPRRCCCYWWRRRGSRTRSRWAPVSEAAQCSRRWPSAWPWRCWPRISCRVSPPRRRWRSALPRAPRLSCVRRSPPSCSRHCCWALRGRRGADRGVCGGYGLARRDGPSQPGGPSTRGRGRASRRRARCRP